MSSRVVSVAGLGHAALISALHGESFDPNREAVWDEKAVTDMLAMPGAFAFIVSEDGQPMGFVMARRAADEAEIISVGTAPEGRRRGIASALIDATAEKAARDGARRLFLEVAADNIAALACYQGRGFVSCGKRPGYYKRLSGPVDAHILARDLRPEEPVA